MPKVSIMTPELNSAVIRPSILDIVRQVQDITKIPKDSRILFMGDMEASYQRGSTMSQAKNERDRTSFAYGNQVTIDIESNYNEGNIFSTAVRQVEHIPIFNDPLLGIIIKPIYSKNDFVINFKFRSASHTDGLRWRDSIRTHVSMMRDVNLHDITYHYLIPNEYIHILKELHRCREAVAGYDEDLDTYLAAHSSTKITAISNQTGTKVGLAVQETQMRILGLYDFQIAPEKPEKDGEASAWVTSFAYKVSFDVPIAVNMQYPIMVHNQLLEYPYVQEEEAYDLDKHNKSYSISQSCLAHFEVTTELDKVREREQVIKLPSFDEFVPSSQPHAMIPIFSALCSVDENDRKTLLNLNELDTYQIDPDVIELIREEYSYLTLPYKSIFHISLYKWSALSTDKSVYVDNELNVKAREDLSLRVNHRVVISMVTDVSMLNKPALMRLKKFRKAGRKALLAINVSTGDLKLIAQKVNLLSLVPELADTGDSLQSLQRSYIQFNTVNASYVITSSNHKLLEEHVPTPFI